MKPETIKKIETVFTMVFELRPGAKLEMPVDDFRAKLKEVQQASGEKISEGKLRGYFQKEGFFLEGYYSTAGKLIFTGTIQVQEVSKEEKFRRHTKSVENLKKRLENDYFRYGLVKNKKLSYELGELLYSLKYNYKPEHYYSGDPFKSIEIGEALYNFLWYEGKGVVDRYRSFGIELIPKKDPPEKPVMPKTSWREYLYWPLTIFAGVVIVWGVLYLRHLIGGLTWMP